MRISFFIPIVCLLCLAGPLRAQQPPAADTLRVLPDSLPPAKPLSGKDRKMRAQTPPDTLRPVVGADTLLGNQKIDSSKIGTPGKRDFFGKNYPNPKTALLLSIIPGGGQAYNRKWWKIPIVYGALGGFTYWAVDNTREYRGLRDAYKAVVDEDPATVPKPPYDQLDATTLRDYRDQFRKFSERTYLALGFIYLLSATDAFVDAQLAGFDVSDDLSLRIRPQFQTLPTSSTPTFGLAFNFQLRSKTNQPINP